MISQFLVKTFDAVRLANGESVREGGWSTPEEISQFKEYVGLKIILVKDLDTLVGMKHVQKKMMGTQKLYRVTEGGIAFFESQAIRGSDYSSPDPWGPPPGWNEDPRKPGQDPFPDKWPDSNPPTGDEFLSRGTPEEEFTTRGPVGAPIAGGVIAPIPMPDISQMI